jgi:hypothetical protein
MEIPAGFSIVDGKLTFTGEANHNTDKSYVVQLTTNMYGLKQASITGTSTFMLSSYPSDSPRARWINAFLSEITALSSFMLTIA